jgi:hypothetical protein
MLGKRRSNVAVMSAVVLPGYLLGQCVPEFAEKLAD